MGDDGVVKFGKKSLEMPVAENDAWKRMCERDPENCVKNHPLSAALTCEDPKKREKVPKTCAEFQRKFPAGSVRNKLFDKHCKILRTPFTVVTEKGKLAEQHLVKSHQVFYVLGDAIVKYHPEILGDRVYSGLYLGSGAHISPILTAMRLIDLGKIDRAEFIFTELNPKTAEDLRDALNMIRKYNPGLFSEPSINGDSVKIIYKGIPITINASVRSLDQRGEGLSYGQSTYIRNYYEEDELRTSDIVVMHDIPVHRNKRHPITDLMRHQRELADGKPRLVVAEDTLSFLDESPKNWYFRTPSPFEYIKINGPYGCGGDAEISTPKYKAAALMSLDQDMVLPTMHSVSYMGSERVALRVASGYLEKSKSNPKLHLKLVIYLAAELYMHHRTLKKAKEDPNYYASGEPVHKLRSDFLDLFIDIEKALRAEDVLRDDETIIDFIDLPKSEIIKRIKPHVIPISSNPPCPK